MVAEPSSVPLSHTAKDPNGPVSAVNVIAVSLPVAVKWPAVPDEAVLEAVVLGVQHRCARRLDRVVGRLMVGHLPAGSRRSPAGARRDSKLNRQPSLSDGRSMLDGGPGSVAVSSPLRTVVPPGSGRPTRSSAGCSGPRRSIGPAADVSPVSVAWLPAHGRPCGRARTRCTSIGPPAVCSTQNWPAVSASVSSRSAAASGRRRSAPGRGPRGCSAACSGVELGSQVPRGSPARRV